MGSLYIVVVSSFSTKVTSHDGIKRVNIFSFCYKKQCKIKCQESL